MMDIAFMRRRDKIDDNGNIVKAGDTDGLSLFDSICISAQDCIELDDSNYGIATVHVGRLRDLGLKVIRDPSDARKALITDAPFENPGDPDLEDLADRIASSARILKRVRWKKPKN